jgi:transcriptional regulator with XRE-family HTH domain
MSNNFKVAVYDQSMSKGRPTDSPRTDFGSRLVALREKRGLTQREIAERLDVSPRAYAFWERKPVALKAEQISALADIFEVSADALLGRNAPAVKRNGPKGKLESLFEAARDLPRGQREKITAILEPFVKEHAS